MEMQLRLEHWKLKTPFRTSRFAIAENCALTVTLRDGDVSGRGECEPHEHDTAIAAETMAGIERDRPAIEAGIDRQELNGTFPAGPARNALDCALWDLEAKRSGRRAWEIAGVALDAPLTTAYTISLDDTREMALQAARNRARPLLKLKLGKRDGEQCVRAVRETAPHARLIVDVNEAWNIDELNAMAGPLSELGVELIEQPLPAGEDSELAEYTGTVPLCADESCLDTASLLTIDRKYDYVNVKLDKTGGLTEALRLVEAARGRGLGIMVGCMNGTSLAMAPAMVVGALADYCDLDGPLLLERDRAPGLVYEDSRVLVPTPEVWG